MRSFTQSTPTPTFQTPSWSELLETAVTHPGVVSLAFSKFHSYSLGNQLLALVQCRQRGIQPGPIATFMRWKDLGRYVKKGERAIVLCMPISHKGTKTVERETDGKIEKQEWEFAYTRFVYRNHWFVLAQTEGAEFKSEPIPAFDTDQALANLDIKRAPFTMLDGNVQGYARNREVAINPLAEQP